MKLLWRLLCIGAVACRWHGDSDFPASATHLSPPAEFRVWWEVVEACSGRRAPFDQVRWYQANELDVRGELALGAWFPAGNRIALLGSESFYGPIVRHEMLHAILGDGSHPREFFQSRCGDAVACGRDCPVPTVPENPTPASLADFDITLDAYPKAPSLSRDNGRMSFVLKVRNRTDRNVYPLVFDYAMAECQVGVLVSSVPDASRTRLACDYFGTGGLSRFFRPGETRSVVIDVDLEYPASGQGPFTAGQLVVGAVLADNVRHTRLVTLRP